MAPTTANPVYCFFKIAKYFTDQTGDGGRRGGGGGHFNTKSASLKSRVSMVTFEFEGLGDQ